MENKKSTVSNSLVAEYEKQEKFNLFLTTDAVKKRINEVIGGERGQRFIASMISFVNTNPALAECDNSTLLTATLLGESLNLTPQLNQYYIIPFENKKEGRVKATFVLSYKGYIQLAIRSGYYKRINVVPIKEGELIKYDALNEEIKVQLIDDEVVRETTPTIGYYAMFEYHNGFIKSLYWSKTKMELHADKYSAAFKLDSYKKLLDGKIAKEDMWKYSSFWYNNFDEMACKTMIRQLISKWGVMSIEMQEAVEKSDNYEQEIANDINGNYVQKDTIFPESESEPKPISNPKSNPKENEIQHIIPGTASEVEEPKIPGLENF